jgi:hypothetical protein
MSITGPGRDVAIQGKLNPGKRSAEDGDPSSRPFTMIRQCDTMFEGLEDYKNDMGGNDTQKDESQDTQSFDTFLDGPDSGVWPFCGAAVHFETMPPHFSDDT